MIASLILAVGTLLPIVNPVSAGFFFNKLVNAEQFSRFKIVNITIFTYFITLSLFALGGAYLLDFFGITIYAFRVAGGIYLAKIAFEMLNPDLRNESLKLTKLEEIAVIPLAIPLLSGPGAMTAALVLTDLYGILTAILAILIVGIVSWVILFYSKTLMKRIGRMGTMVVERVLGLIVLVIAVQMVFNGIFDFVSLL
jgi:multiple antibiotic resistance protein